MSSEAKLAMAAERTVGEESEGRREEVVALQVVRTEADRVVIGGRVEAVWVVGWAEEESTEARLEVRADMQGLAAQSAAMGEMEACVVARGVAGYQVVVRGA